MKMWAWMVEPFPCDVVLDADVVCEGSHCPGAHVCFGDGCVPMPYKGHSFPFCDSCMLSFSCVADWGSQKPWS